MTIEDAKRWMGQPVCVVLKNGSFYVGWITAVENEELTLSGQKGRGKMSSAAIQEAETARLTGFFPETQAPQFGGGWGVDPFGFYPGAGGIPAGRAAPVNPGGGFMGMVGKVWPGIKMGIGMLQTIMPLLGGLKI